MSLPHFILTTTGTRGDVQPFIRLGLGLVAQGARVTLLAPEPHGEQVQAAGLAWASNLPLARYQAVVDNPLVFDPHKGMGVLLNGLEQELPAARVQLLALAGTEPCVVVAHPFTLVAAGLAKAAHPDMRVVGAYLAPSNLRTVYDLHCLGPLPVAAWLPQAARKLLWQQADERFVDPFVLPALNRVRAGLGLPPVTSGFLPHMQAQAELTLTLFPAWFGAGQPDWPQPRMEGSFMLHDTAVGDGLPEAVQAFLEAGTPPLVMTLGTGHQHAAAAYDAGLGLAANTGRRLICLTPFRAQLPSQLPESVLWAPYAPLRLLLPKVSALLHHGGIGTTAEALRAAVPQLVLPFAWDQFDNAFRVQALGVGLTVPGRKVSTARLERALQQLMQDPQRVPLCHRVASLLPHDPRPDLVAGRLLHWAITP